MAGIIALAAAYIMSQFYRSFMAVLTPVLSSELGMTNNELSQSLSAWFVTFALFQFVVGPMLDRIGPRLTASILLLIGGGGGAALFALAQAPWVVILAMALIGVGCSPVLMATFYVFRKVYSPARFAVLSSTFIAIGNAGNLLGASPIAYLSQAYGWREVMWGLCLITILIAVAVYWVMTDPPKSEVKQGASTGSYVEVLKIPALWAIFPICAFSYAVIANIRGLWAGPYFEQVHGLNTSEIGSITFLIAVAMVLGSLFYGPIDTLVNSRKYVVFAGGFLTLLVLIFWGVAPQSTVTKVTILLVLLGLVGMTYGVIVAHGLSFVPAHMTGRGATLLNFFSIGGTGVMQYVSGYVESHARDLGDPVAGFSAVIWLYAGTIAFALVVYLFSKDAKPNPS